MAFSLQTHLDRVAMEAALMAQRLRALARKADDVKLGLVADSVDDLADELSAWTPEDDE